MTRAAVVTGAASGIGAAVSASLERDGYAVAGLDIHPAAPYVVDVSDPAAVADTVARVTVDIGPVDAVVSAAGHYEMAPISNITRQQLHRMLRVHLGGLRNITRSVLPSMLERGTGSIIAITSELAIGGGDADSHYAAAKGAIIGLVRSLGVEVAGRGVRVNAIAPGYFATTNTEALQADETRNRQILERIPAARWGQPQDLAGAALFLSSPASNYVTGTVLTVDGGWMGR